MKKTVLIPADEVRCDIEILVEKAFGCPAVEGAEATLIVKDGKAYWEVSNEPNPKK